MIHNEKLKYSPRLFKSGDTVLIKNQLVGVVLSSSFFVNCYLYRVVVDYKDAVYRITNETIEQDEEGHQDDLDILLHCTEHVGIFSAYEIDLKAFPQK